MSKRWKFGLWAAVLWGHVMGAAWCVANTHHAYSVACVAVSILVLSSAPVVLEDV